MRSLWYEPLRRELSRLVLGTLWLATDDLVAGGRVLDEWVELGGNVIDTAHSYGFADGYGYGDAERALGQWLRSHHDVRDRLVIISKGAHPNAHRARVTPEDITCDLRDSVARLDGPIDLYLLHRDDPTVPVGPIIEVLDAHRRAGRIRAYGTSNWAPRRIDEANAYAAAHALEPFRASSTHLSLAIPNEEHWPGTLAADPTTRDWHARRQMPLFAWSAQAGGFFTGRFSPGDDADSAMRRVYYNDENWSRLRRAQAVASARGCHANDLALAWVLHQQFPVYAIIGPRTVDELRASVAAAEVDLHDDEAAWLNLADDDRAVAATTLRSLPAQ